MRHRIRSHCFCSIRNCSSVEAKFFVIQSLSDPVSPTSTVSSYFHWLHLLFMMMCNRCVLSDLLWDNTETHPFDIAPGIVRNRSAIRCWAVTGCVCCAVVQCGEDWVSTLCTPEHRISCEGCATNTFVWRVWSISVSSRRCRWTRTLSRCCRDREDVLLSLREMTKMHSCIASPPSCPPPRDQLIVANLHCFLGGRSTAAKGQSRSSCRMFHHVFALRQRRALEPVSLPT